MHDVLGQIVLAGGDEDLVAGDLPAAVLAGHRTRSHQAEVGAALRLGQAHRARPAAIGQPGQVARLEHVAAMQRQRLVGAAGQPGIDAEGKIGRGDHLLDDEIDELGQALAAIGGIGGERGPAAGDEGAIGLGESGGRAHHAVLEMAALLVARPVERRQLPLAELGTGGEDGGDGVRRRLLMAGQPAQLPDIEQLLEQEAHLAQRRLVGRHRSAPSARRNRGRRFTTETQRHRDTEKQDVIPAKAGIHLADNALADGWIPAFAGMTRYFLCVSVSLW